MNKVANFFISKEDYSSESLIKYRTKFINIVVLLVTIVTLVMSFVRFFHQEYSISFIDLLVSISTFYMIYIIQKRPEYLQNVIKVFLTLFFLFTFVLIVKVEYESRTALPFMFISAAIFLQGKRAGFFWFLGLFFGLIFIHISSIFDLKLSHITVSMMLIFLFAHYLVLLLYENQQEENNKKLQQNIRSRINELKIQKEALENFKILIDSTIEAVVVFNDKEGIIDCNRGALDMFGYKKEDVLGNDIYKFIYKEDIQKVDENLILEKSEPHEIRVVDSKGKIKPVLVSGANIYFNSKKVRIATMFDLTELKQKDRLLQLQSRHAIMGEMIGMIAHQWRQPLAAISGSVGSLSLDMMMDSYDRDNFQREIENIAEHTQFLSTTIDDFRNFFKDNKQKNDTTLEEVVRSSLNIIGSTLENNKIEVIENYSANEKLYTYSNELKQVVLNIIKNAQDALIDNEIKKPMIMIMTSIDKDKLILEISDNGGGIPDDVIDTIFEPYFTTKEKRDGTGLGLYMSKTIIEEHCNGKIEVSNSESGASFKIILDRS